MRTIDIQRQRRYFNPVFDALTSKTSSDLVASKARRGYACSQYILGIMYLEGKHVEADAKESVLWLRRAAEQGVAEAQHNLGVMCWGYDCDIQIATADLAEALGVHSGALNEQPEKWFRLAAEQGLVEAMYNLGLLLDLSGDPRAGDRWLRRAAKGGLAFAAIQLAADYRNKSRRGRRRWLRLAAKQGLWEAQWTLGEDYFHEFCELRKYNISDPNHDWRHAERYRQAEKARQQADYWWHQAACQGSAQAWHQGQGSAQAQNALGVLWSLPPADRDSAQHWYGLAAEQGLAEACYNLGVEYCGRGIFHLDRAEAAKWFRRTVEQFPEREGQETLCLAEYNLGLLFLWGDGVPVDAGEAARRFRYASGRVRGACYQLGRLLEMGEGVPKDADEAAKYFRVAADWSKKEHGYEGRLLSGWQGEGLFHPLPRCLSPPSRWRWLLRKFSWIGRAAWRQ